MTDARNATSVAQWQKEITAHFEPLPETLIPVLQHVQRKAGYLPREAMTAVSQYLRLSESKVFGVASFYSLFHMKPRGRTQITVCRGTACHVRGSARLLTELENALGIRAGGTTPDMAYSLETVACLGSCALAPIVVKDKVYGRQTTASVRRLIGGPPASVGQANRRGARRKKAGN